MDKAPDYSKYSLEQLYDVYDHINREKYPDRFEMVIKEIKKRELEEKLSGKKQIKHQQKGKIRNFWAVFALGLLTLGIYFIYWLFTNIDEIDQAFTFSKDETIVNTTHKLFIVFIITIILTLFGVIISLFYFTPQEIKTSSIFLFISIIGILITAIFHYYFTLTVNIGQNKAKLNTFSVSKIYSYYITGTALGYIGNFIPILNFAGAIIQIIYYYKIQNQINRIWKEGDFN